MAREGAIETPAAAAAIIRARRTARGLSQQTLADKAGVSMVLSGVMASLSNDQYVTEWCSW